MKQLVIGLGEVGTAIQNILECEGFDIDKNKQKEGDTAKPFMGDGYDVLHICFPWSKDFMNQVIRYRHSFAKKENCLVVVHSSVPIGTCDPHGWVHSPVRGVHPNLEKGIRTFVKYFGGRRAREASQLFLERGVLCTTVNEAKNTEAAKLWDTTQYGMMIVIEKEIHDFCKENGLDFDLVYRQFNQTYNVGYRQLDMPHVVRPYLKHIDGPIGGHCVVENAQLLDSMASTLIITANKVLKERQEKQ